MERGKDFSRVGGSVRGVSEDTVGEISVIWRESAVNP